MSEERPNPLDGMIVWTISGERVDADTWARYAVTVISDLSERLETAQRELERVGEKLMCAELALGRTLCNRKCAPGAPDLDCPVHGEWS